jgi:hypothetical protein
MPATAGKLCSGRAFQSIHLFINRLWLRPFDDFLKTRIGKVTRVEREWSSGDTCDIDG